MITKTDTALIVDAETSTFDWCVYEQHAVLTEGAPPTLIMVGAAKLTEVFHLADGKSNSEWQEIFKNGGKLLLRIVGTSPDKAACFQHAQRLMREHHPRCNIYGHDLKNVRRGILCLTNGRRYDSQLEASKDLGIPQSAISRHLRGGPRHVKGFVFAYAKPEE